MIRQMIPMTRPVMEAEAEEDRSGPTRGSGKVQNGSSCSSRRPRGRRRNNRTAVTNLRTAICVPFCMPMQTLVAIGANAGENVDTEAATSVSIAKNKAERIYKKAKSRKVAEP